MKMRIALLAVMLLVPAVLIVGCSSDSGTGTQPDTTPPLAPVMGGARASNGLIGVWWNPGNEPDLQGYNVYLDINGSVSRVNQVPVTEARLMIPLGGSTSPSASVYVTAVDFSANESGPSASKWVDLLDDIQFDELDISPDEKIFN